MDYEKRAEFIVIIDLCPLERTLTEELLIFFMHFGKACGN